MTMKLKDELITGVEEIDKQHAELFEKFDRLLLACNNRMEIEEIRNIINYLEKYISIHFISEEKLMEKYDYPDKKSHIMEHRFFDENFISIKKVFKEQGGSIEFVRQIKQLLVNWFVQHIESVDKAFAEFIKSKIQ
ncbi:MAG: hypothetical protein A2287_08530 [Candidatus Melainabacteria bacterium RIFOXYA12_FULL_32_12]|nr:MAG: hypothetical protein A2255_03100 [Candidatus Melainabacteria bacterium RIFOXYA2_FULL_32_9]OGI24895.1 MAG: hypothetical protein A2287_08530 [Candidatus Melainabacteria bacterium RIFOXYA12_FULL_32_12]